MRVEDLSVYKKLCDLHLEVHEISLTFPKSELYELGSQVRRPSNSAPANLAEGFGNKYTAIFTECISRSQGEIRETKHHPLTAQKKGYTSREKCDGLCSRYEECSKMLHGLENALLRKRK